MNCPYCGSESPAPGTTYGDSTDKEYRAQEYRCGMLASAYERGDEGCGRSFRVQTDGVCLGVDEICTNPEHEHVHVTMVEGQPVFLHDPLLVS